MSYTSYSSIQDRIKNLRKSNNGVMVQTSVKKNNPSQVSMKINFVVLTFNCMVLIFLIGAVSNGSDI